MLGIPQIHRSFAAGELAPSVAMRADLELYLTGARTIRNFIIQRFGGVTNRTGSRFLAEVKTSANPTWLKKFVKSATQGFVLEVGNGYLRFYKNGARITVTPAAWSAATNYVIGDLVAEGGVNYYAIAASLNQQPPNATFWYPMPAGGILEIPTPYTANLHLLRLTPVQAGNVATFTHKDFAPRELRNISGDTGWTLLPITTAPAIAAPTGLAVANGAAGTLNPKYVVTAAAAETYEESLPPSAVTATNSATPTDAAPNSLSWNAVTGAAEYYVYKDPGGNGTFGFIGVATGQTAFKDIGFIPDFGLTPPIARTLFATSNNFPHAAAFYQQRRVFANTHANVETVWGSRTGFPSNFGISSPIQDDDAVTFAISAAQGIQHLVPLKRLLVLADAGEWIVLGGEERVLTPTGIHPEQEGSAGAAAAPVPVVIGNTVIYVQFLSHIVRDLRFNQAYDGFQSRDLTLLASHLFDKTIVRLDFAEFPHSVTWCCRDDGVLLGLTYLPEFDVFGWHRHDTGASGVYEDVCVVPEGDEHVVYVLVKRTINAQTKRYLERFASRKIVTLTTDAFFVDCGITYTGAAATVIAGLTHLEGQSVVALADGVERGPFTVASGSITLPVAASVVHVGLQITADLELLDLDTAQAPIRDAKKKVQSLSLLLRDSARSFKVGPDSSTLFAVRALPWDTASALVTGLLEENLSSGFSDTGRAFIRTTAPLPLTILGVIPHVDIGG